MRLATFAAGIAGLGALGATALPPPGPNLWNGALAGATIDQVAVAVPQAKPSNGQVLEDGSQSGLSAPAQLAGGPAQAVFFFRSKGLSAVMIEHQALASGHGAENLAEARRIVALATSQYGKPNRCVDRGQLAAISCTWVAGPLRIAVSYHDFGGGSPALSILYRAAP